jgi:hypothetical protein
MTPVTERHTLPPRYEIRKLEPCHLDWVAAIIAHCNLFHSPCWAEVHKEDAVRRCYKLAEAMRYPAGLNISTGLSYGVFDREFEFKRKKSIEEGGALYWDFTDMSVTGEQLLEQVSPWTDTE